MRASSVPNLYAGCLNKCSCNFLFVARVGLCCGFCDFVVSFLVPPDGPKTGTVKVLFFCSFTKLCMRFFEVFVSGLQKRKVLEARNFVAYGDRKGNWGGPFERSWF